MHRKIYFANGIFLQFAAQNSNLAPFLACFSPMFSVKMSKTNKNWAKNEFVNCVD